MEPVRVLFGAPEKAQKFRYLPSQGSDWAVSFPVGKRALGRIPWRCQTSRRRSFWKTVFLYKGSIYIEYVCMYIEVFIVFIKNVQSICRWQTKLTD